MDRIIVEVDDRAAQKWRDAPREKKSHLTATINLMLKKALDGDEDDFWKFVDRIGEIAEANGLTQDVLDKLLSEE